MRLLLDRRSAAVILGGATVLGVFSALQAYYYVSFFSDTAQPFSILLALNMSY